jgi:hypothetical protein
VQVGGVWPPGAATAIHDAPALALYSNAEKGMELFDKALCGVDFEESPAVVPQFARDLTRQTGRP